MPPITIDLLRNLAASVYTAECVKASIPQYEEVLRRYVQVHGEASFETARARAQLGANLAEADEFAREEEMQLQALETLIALRGPEHSRVLVAKSPYASMSGTMGRFDEVLEIIPTVIEVQEKRSGPQRADTLFSRIVLAEAMLKLNDPEAVAYAAGLESEIADVFGTDHWLYETIVPIVEDL